MKLNFLKNRNYKIAIIVSKPLDIYITYNLLEKIPKKKQDITIYLLKGHNTNHTLNSVRKFFPRSKTKFIRSGDLYSGIILNLILIFNSNKIINKKIRHFFLNFLKIIIFLIAKLYWHLIFILNYLKNKNYKYDLLITDPWASKLTILGTFKFNYIIFRDGGNSTDHLKLLDPILVNKKSKFTVINIVKNSLSSQRVKIPFLLKKFILNKITNLPKKNIYFATNKYYIDQCFKRIKSLSKKEISLSKLPKFIIDYEYKKTKKTKLLRNELFILLGKDDDDFYYQSIKSKLKNKKFHQILIKPHPTGFKERKHFPKLIKALKASSSKIIFLKNEETFEEYFMKKDKLPINFLVHSDCSTNVLLNSYLKYGLVLFFF